MFGVLIAFGIATYLMTGSFWATLAQTVACAVVIQVGYFVAVLFFVAREKPKLSERKSGQAEAGVANAQPPFKSITPTETH
jgi:exopolysaccharide production repressor protein